MEKLMKQNLEILSESMYGKAYKYCDSEQKSVIKAELELGGYSIYWKRLFKVN